MARLRKAARVLKKPQMLAAASEVILRADGPYLTFDPAIIFGREAPLEIEIGAGRGDFLIARALDYPERNFLGVELANVVAQLMAARAGRAGLTNLRVARMDARTLVNLMLPDASVSAFHIYFPDPWPKDRHAKHRLFTPYFAASLGRTLVRGATLFVATDVRSYADAIFLMLRGAGFRTLDLAVPGASATSFARKFIAEGRPIYSSAFTR
jgi:tRNA (guanine-N7-)-methyltransferase